ncbi:hypothetical protein AB0K60_22220 [Thermopolyspora sp. NPDC052614]|uniref:hypothetical protein n=1 Tax=Thermopolyspora sp. NPDC052614 TaxID=3155682 RepID=UPI00343B04A3
MTAYNLDTNLVTPGVLGFLVVAAIGLALYFLIKSMNKQISKIEVPHEADLARENQAARQAATGNHDRPVAPGKKE